VRVARLARFLLVGSAVALVLGVSGASAAHPPFWGSVDVSCSETPPFQVPKGSKSNNVIVRIIATNSKAEFSFAGDANEHGPMSWGSAGNDTFWLPVGAAGPTFSSDDFTADGLACSGTGYTVDFADVPTVPTSFSGATTAGNEQIEDSTGAHVTGESDLSFMTPIADDYAAHVSLTQGAITLFRSDGSSQTFTSSGRLDIGSLGPGQHDFPVKTETGPQAIWTIAIQPAPLSITNLSSSVPYIHPDAIVQARYTLSTDADVSVAVRGAGGVVRQLATNISQQAGSHTIDWDGLDAHGNPVPDGAYAFEISATNVFASNASGTAPVTVDSRPPVATPASPATLNRSSGLVINVHDALSGLNTAALAVDGKQVQSLGNGGSQFIYVPSKGWSPGSHAWEVTATDNAGNTGTTAGKFTTPGCRVPQVTGRTLRKARVAVVRHLCSVGQVSRARSRKRLRGHVIAQSPHAGLLLPEHSRVNLTVGRGHGS
jgi:hypothetical protein